MQDTYVVQLKNSKTNKNFGNHFKLTYAIFGSQPGPALASAGPD